MMEKYGADPSSLPVTNEQEDTIKELAKNAKQLYSHPRNQKEAEDLIEKLGGYNND